MNFLLILLAAIIEFTIASAESLRSERWSLAWSAWLNALLSGHRWWRGWPAALVTLVLPVLAAAAVFHVLFSWSHWLGHAASLLFLLCMLGPSDLNRDVERYRFVRGNAPGDEVANYPGFVTLGRGIALADGPAALGVADERADLAGLAVAADRAWFEPLFWFFVLGPVGALLYRLCANLEQSRALDQDAAAIVSELRSALEWLPARITVLALGVAGTLMPTLEAARAFGLTRWGDSADLIGHAALAASHDGRIDEVIGDDPQIYRLNQMHALVKRALTVWLVMFAGAALLLS